MMNLKIWISKIQDFGNRGHATDFGLEPGASKIGNNSEVISEIGKI